LREREKEKTIEKKKYLSQGLKVRFLATLVLNPAFGNSENPEWRNAIRKKRPSLIEEGK
jgi:hypothetical protein